MSQPMHRDSTYIDPERARANGKLYIVRDKSSSGDAGFGVSRKSKLSNGGVMVRGGVPSPSERQLFVAS